VPELQFHTMGSRRRSGTRVVDEVVAEVSFDAIDE
jgi:hypothetical protein